MLVRKGCPFIVSLRESTRRKFQPKNTTKNKQKKTPKLVGIITHEIYQTKYYKLHNTDGKKDHCIPNINHIQYQNCNSYPQWGPKTKQSPISFQNTSKTPAQNSE
jgi:hypothetical protein